MVMEMMETRTTKEKPPVVYDLDDYRHGLRDRANDTEITITDRHRMNLWTIQAGQAVPLHMHTNSECIVIVLAGQGEYRQGDRSFDMKKDTMTVASPGTAHGFRNTNTDPLVVLTIEGPGTFDTRVLEPASEENFY
ncbi:MAG TPA: cupin domain-containing protein [Methanocella sp.]|jgi:mannose-6-phosphate isomerase-like protein (cupin superfamily)